jgi:Protein of unknown function (DUF2442)
LALGERTEAITLDFTLGVEMQDVIEARYVGEYTIWLRFEDGTQGEVDLSGELRGEIFTPLNELAYFKQFYVNAETGTIEWPNRADFAPEFLYEKVHVTA